MAISIKGTGPHNTKWELIRGEGITTVRIERKFGSAAGAQNFLDRCIGTVRVLRPRVPLEADTASCSQKGTGME